MNIYICEDNIQERNWLQTEVAHVLEAEASSLQLKKDFWQPEVILKNIIIETGPHLYFLDIDVPVEPNGLTFAQQIRELDPLGSIIFITLKNSTVKNTLNYLVEPLGFLNKHEFEQQNKFRKKLQLLIQLVLKKSEALNHYTQPADLLSIEEHGKKINIHKKEIVLIEKDFGKKKITLHTSQRSYQLNRFLKGLKEELPEVFFYKRFQSYIFNLNYIEQIDYRKGEITFKTGKQIFLSRSSLKQLKRDLNS